MVYQESVADGVNSEFGLGDTVQSFFFSPKEPVYGWILGAGPAFLWPTATDVSLGSGKWGVGPTFVGLRQEGPWTYGGLFNHIWSYAGDDDRPDVNSTFAQPFLSYTTKTALTYFLNTESTYDWNTSQWTVPINVGANQLLKNRPPAHPGRRRVPLLRRRPQRRPRMGDPNQLRAPVPQVNECDLPCHAGPERSEGPDAFEGSRFRVRGSGFRGKDIRVFDGDDSKCICSARFTRGKLESWERCLDSACRGW